MNNQRRKELEKAIEMLESAKSIIESVSEDEQMSFDNLSEGLQQTERGQRMEEVVELLGDAVDSCDEAIEIIQEAMY